MFGVSDHDLMFALQASRAIEDDAEADDENSARFIQDKVLVCNSSKRPKAFGEGCTK